MTPMPASASAAPAMSHGVGRTPSTAHSQTMATKNIHAPVGGIHPPGRRGVQRQKPGEGRQAQCTRNEQPCTFAVAEPEAGQIAAHDFCQRSDKKEQDGFGFRHGFDRAGNCKRDPTLRRPAEPSCPLMVFYSKGQNRPWRFYVKRHKLSKQERMRVRLIRSALRAAVSRLLELPAWVGRK